MVVNIHINTSYLSETKVKGRAGGHYFMSENIADPTDNGDLLNVSQAVDNMVSSTLKAEIGPLYLSSHQAILVRTAVE